MSLFGKIYHEITFDELEAEEGQGPGLAHLNEALFKRFLGIAQFQGTKIHHIICGKEAAQMLACLPDGKMQLKEEPFYLMGYHGIVPYYVDTSLGRLDILVVCKKGIEKISIKDYWNKKA
jgi:hypothetical protein